ncbi:ATP-dependent zinc metalloprotease FtsH [Endomicrobium proavitum]|uniref:ATP-dependent zinc metalloprotease FtsH n=1 Tax=Endomicrobium proavitum TaxID=1408281 RepID=A0A0G3WK38_9BACT|nr:ATP-dependent zinc metalloprotease FtsH [Endomicrobium proavitum]AKL98247.1 protease, ATP-dependent zinc-metallo [Endomicrobium proavitum]
MKQRSPWFVIFWVALFAMIFMLMNSAKQKQGEEKLEYSQFKQYVTSGAVTKVVVSPEVIKGEFKDADGTVKKFKTVPMNDPSLIKDMEAAKIKNFSASLNDKWFLNALISFGPIIILIIFFLWMMKGMSNGNKQAMSFGKSKAKLAGSGNTKVTFKDVAGANEAKEELSEVVEFLKDPAKFQKLGGKIPKGVLLVGAPGTGKTLLAKAVAGEAGVPFFSSSGSEFVEMFVGVGASRVRDLFEQGRRNAPCLLFVDEIDAVGRHRGAGLGGGHDEREQTLNQLLVEMDGFDTKEGVILIAATNRPDVLDPALLRPGRFDRQVVVARPELKDREQILEVHAKKVKLADDVNLNVIAKQTPGFVGADLANIINEGALLAARYGQENVTMKNFEEAIDRVYAGPARKSMLRTEKEIKMTAYHEAGHALVAKFLPGTDPVHKVTIIPRGAALGYTMQLPEYDKNTISKKEALNQIAIFFGGRAAEEIVYKDITSGATQDIAEATKLATKMVAVYGMSDKVGPMALDKGKEEIFLGRDISKDSHLSEKMSELIDYEIKKIIDAASKKAVKILTDNRKILDKVVDYLIDRETLSGQDLDKIVKGEKLAAL